MVYSPFEDVRSGLNEILRGRDVKQHAIVPMPGYYFVTLPNALSAIPSSASVPAYASPYWNPNYSPADTGIGQPSDSGTMPVDDGSQIAPQYSSLVPLLTQAFREAEYQEFEDGMDSEFSTELNSLVQGHGELAVRAIDDIIRSGNFGAGVIAEALKQIGAIFHEPTREARLALLLRQLKDDDPRVRDGASLGIADIDDPNAINDVREALTRERYPLLSTNLQLVLDQLIATQRCLDT
jgi:hypothetical protein